MSSVTIDLLDEKTIGKNYQLAALGSILDDLPKDIKDKIIKGIMINFIQLNSVEYDIVKKHLSKRLESVCSFSKDPPKLYTAGKPMDRDILVNAKILKKTDGRLSCESVKEAIDRLSIQELAQPAPMPMFLRPYVFSYYRNASKIEKITVGSLLIATVGLLISFVGGLRTAGGTRIDIHIIPDGSMSSLNVSRTFYNLLYLSNIGASSNFTIPSLLQLIRDITNELGGVSIDQAIFLSFMIYMAYANDISGSISSDIESLTNSNSFESFMLARIDSAGNRPQLMSATPLSISWALKRLMKRRSLSLLKNLNWLVSSSIKSENADFKASAEAASSKCLSSLFKYMESNYYDALLECSRDLATICDKANNLLEGNKGESLRNIRNVKQAAENLLSQLPWI